MTSDPLSVLVRAIGQAGDAVAGVKPDQAELPTPCRSWNVRQLVEHLIHDMEQFIKTASGGKADWSAPAASSSSSAAEAAESWVQAYQSRADALTAAWGAAELTGTTELPGLGEVPARTPVDMQVAELAVHAWDLATATGQSIDLDPEVAEVGLAMMRANLAPQFRGTEAEGKSFGPEVDPGPDAGPYERLVAFAGRDPRGL
jgi:uncharacterized protein (TIGR03086 family)